MTSTETGPPGDGRVRVLRVIARLNVGGPALHVTLYDRLLDESTVEGLRGVRA